MLQMSSFNPPQRAKEGTSTPFWLKGTKELGVAGGGGGGGGVGVGGQLV